MKNLIKTIVLSSVVPVLSLAADCCSNWYVQYENVIVKPHFTRNNAYFLEDPPGIVGQTAVQFDWDFCYSPRIELGWNSNCDYGARVRYWHFDQDNTLHAKDPNGDIASFFSEDSSNQDIGFSRTTEAVFTHDLKVKVFDLEGTVDWCHWIYSAGFRYAKLEQRYVGQDLEENGNTMISTHDFSGWGLTMAAEYLKPIKCGFSVFSKMRGSLLYGESSWLAYNPAPTAQDQLYTHTDNDLQAVGELQLGIDWRKCFCGDKIGFIRIAAEAQYWANGGAAGPGCNAVYDEGNYQNSHPQDSGLGFIGVNVAFGIEF